MCNFKTWNLIFHTFYLILQFILARSNINMYIYIYRLHHDMEVGEGFTQARAEHPRMAYITHWPNGGAQLTCAMALGYRKRLTYSPPRRWVWNIFSWNWTIWLDGLNVPWYKLYILYKLVLMHIMFPLTPPPLPSKKSHMSFWVTLIEVFHPTQINILTLIS